MKFLLGLFRRSKVPATCLFLFTSLLFALLSSLSLLTIFLIFPFFCDDQEHPPLENTLSHQFVWTCSQHLQSQYSTHQSPSTTPNLSNIIGSLSSPQKSAGELLAIFSMPLGIFSGSLMNILLSPRSQSETQFSFPVSALESALLNKEIASNLITLTLASGVLLFSYQITSSYQVFLALFIENFASAFLLSSIQRYLLRKQGTLLRKYSILTFNTTFSFFIVLLAFILKYKSLKLDTQIISWRAFLFYFYGVPQSILTFLSGISFLALTCILRQKQQQQQQAQQQQLHQRNLHLYNFQSDALKANLQSLNHSAAASAGVQYDEDNVNNSSHPATTHQGNAMNTNIPTSLQHIILDSKQNVLSDSSTSKKQQNTTTNNNNNNNNVNSNSITSKTNSKNNMILFETLKQKYGMENITPNMLKDLQEQVILNSDLNLPLANEPLEAAPPSLTTNNFHNLTSAPALQTSNHFFSQQALRTEHEGEGYDESFENMCQLYPTTKLDEISRRFSDPSRYSSKLYPYNNNNNNTFDQNPNRSSHSHPSLHNQQQHNSSTTLQESPERNQARPSLDPNYNINMQPHQNNNKQSYYSSHLIYSNEQLANQYQQARQTEHLEDQIVTCCGCWDENALRLTQISRDSSQFINLIVFIACSAAATFTNYGVYFAIIYSNSSTIPDKLLTCAIIEASSIVIAYLTQDRFPVRNLLLFQLGIATLTCGATYFFIEPISNDPIASIQSLVLLFIMKFAINMFTSHKDVFLISVLHSQFHNIAVVLSNSIGSALAIGIHYYINAASISEKIPSFQSIIGIILSLCFLMLISIDPLKIQGINYNDDSVGRGDAADSLWRIGYDPQEYLPNSEGTTRLTGVAAANTNRFGSNSRNLAGILEVDSQADRSLYSFGTQHHSQSQRTIY